MHLKPPFSSHALASMATFHYAVAVDTSYISLTARWSRWMLSMNLLPAPLQAAAELAGKQRGLQKGLGGLPRAI